MNEVTEKFIETLKNDENVSGVILFGSWARGNNRQDSDVDLVVILENGYQRTHEKVGNQNFEIIYTTADSALEYWKQKPDDAANLWEVAKILFDRYGKVSEIKLSILNFLSTGKKLIDEKSKAQLRFSAEDTLLSVKSLRVTNPATAMLVLEKTVLTLTEQYFDLKQLWTPAPKQRILKIKELDPDFYSLLNNYYSESVKLERKIELAGKITTLVFA
ncbi:MAG: nucleotidyltransferase domain-containing protein [Candidatus Paceibacteria bacterium]